ncbi:hypothetical protein D3C75_922330 [compost metagenome]
MAAMDLPHQCIHIFQDYSPGYTVYHKMMGDQQHFPDRAEIKYSRSHQKALLQIEASSQPIPLFPQLSLLFGQG